MSEFLSFDAHGDLYLTLPDAQQIRARQTGGDTFLVELGHLTATVDLAWMIHVQAVFTRALCDAGYGIECTTPESLLRDPTVSAHSPSDGGGL